MSEHHCFLAVLWAAGFTLLRLAGDCAGPLTAWGTSTAGLFYRPPGFTIASASWGVYT
jgi:hypothetical protein